MNLFGEGYGLFNFLYCGNYGKSGKDPIGNSVLSSIPKLK